MKLQVLELTEEDRAGLLRIVERGRDWRMRHRAQTLLYFGDGWRAKAIAAQQLFAATWWETMTAMLFVGFLGLLMEHVGKPLEGTLDNASAHKAKEIEPLLKVLQGKGLKLYFLPAYSPELNRIEKLWHKMKYEWMAFKSRDAQTLEADVDEILLLFRSTSDPVVSGSFF